MKIATDQAHLHPDWTCLQFANSIEWRGGRNPIEHLHTYADLLDWGLKVGALAHDEAARLADAAAGRPAEANRAFARAILLREALYRIFSAAARQLKPPADDLALLNQELHVSTANRRLEGDCSGFRWEWEHDLAMDRPLWKVADSASELLTSPVYLERLKECADDHGCAWLFIDTTRNRSRMWCSMDGCGNRAKAQRHYRRKQEARA